MQIKQTLERIPGGLMVIPLLMGAIVNTFFPQALQIGGFTTALFKNGAMAIIGCYLFCAGAQMNFVTGPKAVKKGVILTLIKYAVGVGIGLSVAKISPEFGLFGLTPLAIIAAMTNSNGGLYVALTAEYGDETDVGAISILVFNDGPFFTMLALGASGLASIPFMAFVAVLVPIFAGLIIGNLDPEMRKFLGQGERMLIPFFAFPLGAAMNFNDIIKAGIPGILLGVMTVVITGMAGYLALRAFGERGLPGAAEGSTAGNAVATPAAIALVDPNLQHLVPSATAQCAAACITTAFLCPVLVVTLNRWLEKRGIYCPKKLQAMAEAKAEAEGALSPS